MFGIDTWIIPLNDYVPFCWWPHRIYICCIPCYFCPFFWLHRHFIIESTLRLKSIFSELERLSLGLFPRELNDLWVRQTHTIQSHDYKAYYLIYSTIIVFELTFSYEGVFNLCFVFSKCYSSSFSFQPVHWESSKGNKMDLSITEHN